MAQVIVHPTEHPAIQSMNKFTKYQMMKNGEPR